MFLGAFGIDLGVFGTRFTYAFRERENLLDLFEEVSGDRLMYAYFRPGGVAWDVPRNFDERVRGVLRAGADRRQRPRRAADRQRDLHRAHARTSAALSAEDAIDYGAQRARCCAPPACQCDLRRDEPYSIYDRFDFDIPVGNNGDSYDRYLVRLEEMRAVGAHRRAGARADAATGRSCRRSMPRRLRTAAGEVYCAARTRAASTASTSSRRAATSPTG